ncbi:MAG: hypothetical protein KBA66_22365 [Leptospiraceae bacterium]|nr:hypothetical protein [Leptospiraceae bacterium]
MLKHLFYILIIFIFCACSTAPGEFDIHPDHLVGQKFFSPTKNADRLFVLNSVPGLKPIKQVKVAFTEYFPLPVFIFSLGGKKNIDLEEVLASELVSVLDKVDSKTEILVVHNIQLSMKTNQFWEFSNNYIPGGYFGRYVAWECMAEVGSISKENLKALLSSNSTNIIEPVKK